jgi:hypothetical protein
MKLFQFHKLISYMRFAAINRAKKSNNINEFLDFYLFHQSHSFGIFAVNSLQKSLFSSV